MSSVIVSSCECEPARFGIESPSHVGYSNSDSCFHSWCFSLIGCPRIYITLFACRQRYDVVEPDSEDFTLPHPEDLNPNRPFGRPQPPRPFTPEPNYPLINPNPSYRPPRPLPPPSSPVGANRPPPGVDRYDPTDVSKCKCVHAFNCESNALQFVSSIVRTTERCRNPSQYNKISSLCGD